MLDRNIHPHFPAGTPMSFPDPHGQVALMLCESILHVLVEEGVISNDKALEVIDGVIELAREDDEMARRRSASRSVVQLLEQIAQSFAAKALDEVTAPAARRSPGCLRVLG
jgi:hypothetical protein